MVKLQARNAAENLILTGFPTQALSCSATVPHLLIFMEWIWLPPQAHSPIQWTAAAVLQTIVPGRAVLRVGISCCAESLQTLTPLHKDEYFTHYHCFTDIYEQNVEN